MGDTSQKIDLRNKKYPHQNMMLPESINPYQNIQDIKAQIKSQIQNQKPNNVEKEMDKHSIYPSIQYIYTIKNSSVKKKRLKQYLKQYYTNKILQCQYKKCTCHVCCQMSYPMLIPFNCDSQIFYEDHSNKFQQIWKEREKKSGKNIYNYLFSMKKSLK